MSIMRVTSEFFKVIGVQPAIGRPFTADEDKPGQNRFVVLSHGVWQTRFGGKPSILGTTIDIDGEPWRIIGVMPQGFAFPRPDVQAWVPMGLDPLRRAGFTNSGLGRLKPSITPQHAEAQTTAIMWDWARQGATAGAVDPSRTKMKTIVRPLQEALTGRTIDGAVGCGLPDSPHGHGKRRHAVVEPRRWTAARDQPAHGARRDPHSRHTPTPHREHCAGSSRCGRRDRARHARCSRLHAFAARFASTYRRSQRRRTRPGIHARHFRPQRYALWSAPRAPRLATASLVRPNDGTARELASYGTTRQQWPRRYPALAVGRAAHRRGARPQELSETHIARLWLLERRRDVVRSLPTAANQ